MTVLTPEGTPVRGCGVVITGGPEPLPEHLPFTDERGQVSRRLATGEYDLEILCRGAAEGRTFTVAGADLAITVVVPRAAGSIHPTDVLRLRTPWEP